VDLEADDRKNVDFAGRFDGGHGNRC